jgi:hypothetical protein
MGHGRRSPPRRLLLTFVAEGGAELAPVLPDGTSGVILWASDDDDDFIEEFGTRVLDENEFEEVVDYLIERGEMTEAEGAALDIDVETLSAGAHDEDSDEEPDLGEW